MANKRIGKADEELIIFGAVAVGLFLLGKPIINSLSSLLNQLPGANSEANQTVADQNTVALEENPFNINYKYSLYARNPGTYGAAWWVNLNNQFLSYGNPQTAVAANGVYLYPAWAWTLNDAFGTFSEDDSVVDAVFNQVRSKADVANLATLMYFVYQIDLFTLLNSGNGFIPGVSRGLSTTHLATIINKVSSLPDSN